jgi:hypothetical protein
MTDESLAAQARPAPPFEAFCDGAVTRSELLAVRSVRGVDDEIDLLRARLQQLVRDRPDDVALMLRGAGIIARTVSARYQMSPQRAEDLEHHLEGVVRTLAEQLFPERFADV